jgi:hypothetical protein
MTIMVHPRLIGGPARDVLPVHLSHLATPAPTLTPRSSDNLTLQIGTMLYFSDIQFYRDYVEPYRRKLWPEYEKTNVSFPFHQP